MKKTMERIDFASEKGDRDYIFHMGKYEMIGEIIEQINMFIEDAKNEEEEEENKC